MKRSYFLILIALSQLLQSQTSQEFPLLKGNYLGQKPPELTAEVFAPGIASDTTWAEHCQMAVSPDGAEIFWSAYAGNYPKKAGFGNTQQLFYSKRIDGIWTKPAIPQFTKANRYGNNGGPVFSLDGSRLYFYQCEAASASNKITYYVEKVNGKWGNTPIHAGAPYNNHEHNWTPIFTNKGYAYKYNQEKRVAIKFRYENHLFSQPDTLRIHKDFRLSHSLYVSPNEDYMIFSAWGHGSVIGGTDLFICFKTGDDTWGYPLNMGESVNTKLVERFPMVSPDGKYFFFMRHTPGQDFFWISTDIFVDLKKKSEQTVDFKKNMILVEGGSFPKGESQKKRSVDSFLISKYEVTQKEYIAVMNTNPSLRYGLDHPVEKISWYDATKYCNTLSKSEGLTPCYSGHKDNIVCNFEANGYRLPTETEWEYAAIGGKHHTNQSTANAPSDTLDAYVWHYGNSNNNSHPVGEKLANPLGLHDMGGNVWEWCWNSYQPNPTGNANGKNREKVVRGGGWPDDVDLCRSDFQYSAHPNRLAYCIGFRVVRSL